MPLSQCAHIFRAFTDPGETMAFLLCVERAVSAVGVLGLKACDFSLTAAVGFLGHSGHQVVLRKTATAFGFPILSSTSALLWLNLWKLWSGGVCQVEDVGIYCSSQVHPQFQLTLPDQKLDL